MGDLIAIAITALFFTTAALILPYVILLALVNLVYRLASGRLFRWLSLRTALPFLLLVACVWGLFLYALHDGRAFLITH